MKLRPERIELLSTEILKILKSEAFIEILDFDKASASIQSAITDDFMVEIELDAEVKQILEQYADKIDQDRIQYYQMFKMVKEKLAKERKLIL
jgi:hypothetical protein